MDCSVGKDGPDTGTGFDIHGHKYTFQGIVRNRKPNGLGVKIHEDGYVFYGNFKDGKVQVPFIQNDFGSMWYFGNGFSELYDSRNPSHCELKLSVRVMLPTLCSLVTAFFGRTKCCCCSKKHDQVGDIMLTGTRQYSG
eukprot:m.71529 g.71529  ORF g.71529 m.71529 type:complete len:138 (+) comp12254_c0_seq1:219-632(+)